MIAALILSSLVSAASLLVMVVMIGKEGVARNLASAADEQRVAAITARFDAEACAKAAGDEAVHWRELHDRLLAKHNRRRVGTPDNPETKHG